MNAMLLIGSADRGEHGNRPLPASRAGIRPLSGTVALTAGQHDHRHDGDLHGCLRAPPAVRSVSPATGWHEGLFQDSEPAFDLGWILYVLTRNALIWVKSWSGRYTLLRAHKRRTLLPDQRACAQRVVVPETGA